MRTRAIKGWLQAKPWQFAPVWPTGWHYWTIYCSFRREFHNPQTGRLISPREKPLLALWHTICFPHDHGDDE